MRGRLKEFILAEAEGLGIEVNAVHFVSAFTGEGLRGLFKVTRKPTTLQASLVVVDHPHCKIGIT